MMIDLIGGYSEVQTRYSIGCVSKAEADFRDFAKATALSTRHSRRISARPRAL
jgi:hypothetical protein